MSRRNTFQGLHISILNVSQTNPITNHERDIAKNFKLLAIQTAGDFIINVKRKET
jgi:hypothetical protein